MQDRYEFSDSMLRKKLEEIIKWLIHINWVRGKEPEIFSDKPLKNKPSIMVKLKERKTEGKSDSIRYRVDIRMDNLSLKYSPNDSKELEGYYLLSKQDSIKPKIARYLLSPLFEPEDEESKKLYLTTFVDSLAFSTLMKHFDDKKDTGKLLLNIYDDFLMTMKDLWLHTREDKKDAMEIYRDKFKSRCSELKELFEFDNVSKSSLNLKININDHIVTLSDVEVRFFSEIEKLKNDFTLCMTHGDEHGGNILVYDLSSPSAWLLIDYASVNKLGDWIFAIAKMKTWIENEKIFDDCKVKNGETFVKYNKTNNALELSFDENDLNLKYQLYKEINSRIDRFAEQVASEFNDSDWKKRLRFAMSILAFGYGIKAIRDLETQKAPMIKNSRVGPVMFYKSLKYLNLV